jgi:SAM-dependent methyltransferase
MFAIATVRETTFFHQQGLPMSGVPLPFSTRQWEYPWCYSRLTEFKVSSGQRVLDVGCACNPFTVDLSRRGFYVTGLDLFSVNDRRNPHPHFAGFDYSYESEFLKLCEGGMEAIPLPNNSFGAVYCLSVLEHCDEAVRRAGIREMLRVLKPGGPLIITEDYIPKAIGPLPGVLQVCSRVMDYDFRDHINSTQRPLADSSARIPSDGEIAAIRDRGELLLNCAVAPNEYYHFTAVGWVVVK